MGSVDFRKRWKEEDDKWAKYNTLQLKTMVKILNQAIARKEASSYIQKIKEIVQFHKMMGEELHGPNDDRTISTDGNMRFTYKQVKKTGGGPGAESKDVTNIKPKDLWFHQRSDVRYRWKNKPGKDNPSSPNSDGFSQAG